jgi:hypothetical protein
VAMGLIEMAWISLVGRPPLLSNFCKVEGGAGEGLKTKFWKICRSTRKNGI